MAPDLLEPLLTEFENKLPAPMSFYDIDGKRAFEMRTKGETPTSSYVVYLATRDQTNPKKCYCFGVKINFNMHRERVLDILTRARDIFMGQLLCGTANPFDPDGGDLGLPQKI